MANEVNVCVEHGRLNALEDAAGAVHPGMDAEEHRVLLAHLHAAQRAIHAHENHEQKKFSVKASPSELHVVCDD